MAEQVRTAVLVSGRLHVDPAAREGYLATCVAVVRAARETPGCLDFALSADLVDESRINVLERWSSRSALDAFRGDGVGDEQGSMIRSAQVEEFDVAAERSLS